ncbi:TlpA family protein disulfide reductase [Anaplasma capra]|uniref:TlpA family protein disulfide reductase n=1 Tax=Anaplasma capra TaxID=1562740 RepID=UPI0021D5FA15|nr:TlpA disulfide reductase family protein [Anaplasma capra]MCU7612085.1 TlpA family protein disulfide reductase [Anaplasma capra]
MGRALLTWMCWFLLTATSVFFQGSVALGDDASEDVGGLPKAFIAGELRENVKMANKPFFDLSGKEFSAKDFEGRVLVVAFWAPWSLESVALLRELQAIWDHLNQKEIKDKITFLPISYGDRHAVRSFCKEYGISMTVYLDEGRALFDYFNVRAIPLTLIVDRGGLVLYRIDGNVKWDGVDVIGKLLSIASQ